MADKNEIPPLDSPYGPNAWRQPSREAIVVDDRHALMTRATFEELSEYSATIPSGVYPGKMWRRHDGIHEGIVGRRRPPAEYPWLLCWYGRTADPARCSVNFREVLLA